MTSTSMCPGVGGAAMTAAAGIIRHRQIRESRFDFPARSKYSSGMGKKRMQREMIHVTCCYESILSISKVILEAIMKWQCTEFLDVRNWR